MSAPSLFTQLAREECAHKQMLIDSIRTAISEILKLHDEEFEAVMKGDFDTGAAIERRLNVAREQKALMIELYRDHVNSHGC